jgi:hypothetical protein
MSLWSAVVNAVFEPLRHKDTKMHKSIVILSVFVP